MHVEPRSQHALHVRPRDHLQLKNEDRHQLLENQEKSSVAPENKDVNQHNCRHISRLGN